MSVLLRNLLGFIDSLIDYSETPTLYVLIFSHSSFVAGVSDDELFGNFFSALEKIHYFKPASDGRDDEVQLDRATRLFHNAAMVGLCTHPWICFIMHPMYTEFLIDSVK